MNNTAKLAAVLTILVGLSAATAGAKPTCVQAGGEATMLTEDLARYMATKALGNSISGLGAKPSGAVKVTCTPATLSTYCIAKQRACKG